ncbi:MAG: D-3-phosphoglycerate dehydrogenase / 2-oxoglutarate reductase [Micromonosporaceae bacterium]
MSVVEALVIGDEFIPPGSYEDAFAELSDGEDLVRLRSVRWRGSKSDQHETQQAMERAGANAVPAPPELLAAVPGAVALCLHFAPVGAQVLAAAPELRVVAVARSGLENVDIATATERGIAVVPAHGRNAGAVAELQLALMLAEARNVARADASIKSGGWRKEFPGARVEVAGRTVGMVGFGHVGQVFSGRLAGFGCRLLAYDPYATDEALAAAGVTRASTLDDVFVASDFVVVQARHTAETDRFIGERELRLMRPDAYFVNVARSRLVDSGALLAVLREGAIAGAGIDVYDEEPLAPDSPWRGLDNATLTTHFGGDTEDTNRTSARLVAEAVLEFARTGKVARAVNAADLGWA